MDFGGAKNENLEVTGVSRSGRVRKKSSKLLDFESTDEVEGKHRKKSFPETPQRVEKIMKPKTPKSPKPPRNDIMEVDDRSMYDQYAGNPTNSSNDYKQSYLKKDPDEEDNSDVQDEEYTAETDEDENEEMDDDDYEGNLVVDEKTPAHQSLYMSEKNRKKSVMKDGKLVPQQRSRRKDKGKSRFTAYMMWAKEVRQALNKQFPDMDFSTMARRLSEMWATVPNSEREHWKRKAKRESLKKAKAKQDAPLMPSRKFINKKGGPIAPLMNSPATLAQKPTPQHHDQKHHVVRKVVDVAPVTPAPVAPAPVAVPSSPQYKVTGIAPIDIAAHLKLLGESLSVIGERLQEHEGQIAVSGSLSVLLDSLLCSMGALVCLTQQVPDLQPATDPDCLSKILNNIAYTMPGLG